MSEHIVETHDIILKLKAVRVEKGYSFGDILTRMEQNGDYVSKSTLSRVFADGSEDSSFSYEGTIRPIAKALLDIETIEEGDDMDVQTMKLLLKYKIDKIVELEGKIKDLEAALTREKLKSHEKLDREREMYNRRVDFLKEQISLKDKRMDQLLEAVFKKDKHHEELFAQLMECKCCSKRDEK